jgi:hypothetical protein
MKHRLGESILLTYTVSKKLVKVPARRPAPARRPDAEDKPPRPQPQSAAARASSDARTARMT